MNLELRTLKSQAGAPQSPSRPAGVVGQLPGADVVAKEGVHVAQVELAVGDDGVRPGLFVAAVGLLEAAMFFVAVRRGFDEDDGAFVLGAQVEAVVGVDEGAFAELVVAQPLSSAWP